MKNLLILLVLMITVKTFSQEMISSNQKNDKVDKIYESPFIKGGYGFRQKFYEIFDGDKVNGKGTLKSEAAFTVTSEGKIADLKVTGTNISMNNEMERAINEMNKFELIPKKLDGKPINSKYRFPIELTFVE